MRTVKKIVKPNIKNKKLRVAAYCRVSKDSDSLERSLKTQIDYFRKKIESNNDYEFVRVYFDNGISGTRIKNRLEFQEMIDDCISHKIDMIFCKSISRFARNTVDLLKTIRLLKSLNIPVIFEKENLNSMSKDSDLLLSIMASCAESESKSMSENILWSYKKRFQKGVDQYRPTFGYDYINKKYVINEKEAKIVKLIYSDFLKGLTYQDITRKIRKMGIKTRRGNIFNYPEVKVILKNERYTGDIILQKTYVASPLTHYKKKNNGEKEKYIVKNAVPRIIEKSDYRKVQVIIKKLSKDKMFRCRHKKTIRSGINGRCKS